MPLTLLQNTGNAIAVKGSMSHRHCGQAASQTKAARTTHQLIDARHLISEQYLVPQLALLAGPAGGAQLGQSGVGQGAVLALQGPAHARQVPHWQAQQRGLHLQHALLILGEAHA